MTSLSDTGKIDPLLVLRGTAQLSVAPSADIVETGSPQPAGELLCGIGPLPVDLQLPLPCTVPAAVEEIHVIGTQSPVILRAPDAVGVLRLVQKDLSIQRRQLGHGIDVEHQQPAGGDEQVQPPEGALHIGGAGEIVQAVQTADGGIHRAVKIQLGHGLVQEDGGDALHLSAFLHGGGQHLLGAIHADEFIAPARQQPRHGAGAAGQIQHRVDGDTAAAEELFQKVRPLLVAYVGGQGIVGRRKPLIAAHDRPPSSCPAH